MAEERTSRVDIPGNLFLICIYSDEDGSGIVIGTNTDDKEALQRPFGRSKRLLYATIDASTPDTPLHISSVPFCPASLHILGGVTMRRDKPTQVNIIGIYPPPDFEGFDKDDPELHGTAAGGSSDG